MHIAAEPAPVPVGGAGLIGLFRESARRDPDFPRKRLGESRHGTKRRRPLIAEATLRSAGQPRQISWRITAGYQWPSALCQTPRGTRNLGLLPSRGELRSSARSGPTPTLSFDLPMSGAPASLARGSRTGDGPTRRRLYANQETFCQLPHHQGHQGRLQRRAVQPGPRLRATP